MALVYLLYSASITLVCYTAWKALLWLLHPYLSTLRYLPGPPNASFIYGNLKEVWASDMGAMQERWVQEYGPTITYKGLFSRTRLHTLDPRALNHVLTHPTEFTKPAQLRDNLERMVGKGLFTAEGDAHRRQRRVMNPAFGPAQIREFTGIFLNKSEKLRDLLHIQLANAQEAPVKVDVLAWLSRATLDMIGLAGFNYAFDALDGSENELNRAFATMFQTGTGTPMFQTLQAMIPPLRLIRTKRDRTVGWAQKTMRSIGLRLIEQRKAAIQAEKAGGQVEKGDVQGRDLLSLLVRANMAVDIPDNQRLSDEDMLAQIPTFLVAGHETTSTSTTWALFALAQVPDVQARLRAELQACPTDAPTMEQLTALPYLDAVVREVLRVHAPVASTRRIATCDTVIPLAEPFLDKDGVRREEIRVSKGDDVMIPIRGMHRAKSMWGPDAHEFRPERWLEPMPQATHNVPGVWGNLLTFLGGPHACIGYRFSLVEMKALLFVLLRAFEFELAVPASQIKTKQRIVARPFIVGEKGNQMPLLVRRCGPQA